MARKQSDGPSKTDIDMTPMIDMTFQLITFFVFTLNFSTAVQDDRVQLPMSQLAKPYTNPQLSAVHRRNFLSAINIAKAEAMHGQAYQGQKWSFPQTFTRRKARW